MSLQARQLRISNAKIGPGATWYKSHTAARGSVIIRYRFNRISLFPWEIRRCCSRRNRSADARTPRCNRDIRFYISVSRYKKRVVQTTFLLCVRTELRALFIHSTLELRFNSTCPDTVNRRVRNNCVIALGCRHLNYERCVIFHVFSSTFLYAYI